VRCTTGKLSPCGAGVLYRAAMIACFLSVDRKHICEYLRLNYFMYLNGVTVGIVVSFVAIPWKHFLLATNHNFSASSAISLVKYQMLLPGEELYHLILAISDFLPQVDICATASLLASHRVCRRCLPLHDRKSDMAQQ
jgi:hypothetical protein